VASKRDKWVALTSFRECETTFALYIKLIIYREIPPGIVLGHFNNSAVEDLKTANFSPSTIRIKENSK
jgi:hypothetical protein